VLSVANLRVARASDEVVGYVALNVRAKVGPGLVGMVNLVRGQRWTIQGQA
jgi:hypothetical protein